MLDSGGLVRYLPSRGGERNAHAAEAATNMRRGPKAPRSTAMATRISRFNSTWIAAVSPLVVQAAHAQVDGRSRHPARLVGRHEDRQVCQLLERHESSRMGPACEELLPLFPGHARCLGARLEGFLDRACLQHGLL